MVKTHASNVVRGVGPIPGLGPKIPCATMWPNKKLHSMWKKTGKHLASVAVIVKIGQEGKSGQIRCNNFVNYSVLYF